MNAARRMVMACLLLAGLEVQAEQATVTWRVPGCYYPVLGWRMPVDLAASEEGEDWVMRDVDPTRYNCHFYTRLHLLRWQDPTQMLERAQRPRHDLITGACLEAAGWHRRARGESPQPGDIMLAGRPAVGGGLDYTHSAVVAEVNDQGAVVRIRQKFDGRHPVVDVDPIEFRMLYAGLHPYRTEIWTAPDAPSSQWAQR